MRRICHWKMLTAIQKKRWGSFLNFLGGSPVETASQLGTLWVHRLIMGCCPLSSTAIMTSYPDLIQSWDFDPDKTLFAELALQDQRAALIHLLATKSLESIAGKWHENVSGGWHYRAGKGRTTLSELHYNFILVKGTCSWNIFITLLRNIGSESFTWRCRPSGS